MLKDFPEKIRYICLLQVDVKMELPVPPKFVEALKNISADEGTQVVFQGVVEGNHSVKAYSY